MRGRVLTFASAPYRSSWASASAAVEALPVTRSTGWDRLAGETGRRPAPWGRTERKCRSAAQNVDKFTKFGAPERHLRVLRILPSSGWEPQEPRPATP
jgi:hypothetical protein